MAYVLVVLSSSIEQHHFELFSSTLFSRVARRPAQGGGRIAWTSAGHYVELAMKCGNEVRPTPRTWSCIECRRAS